MLWNLMSFAIKRQIEEALEAAGQSYLIPSQSNGSNHLRPEILTTWKISISRWINYKWSMFYGPMLTPEGNKHWNICNHPALPSNSLWNFCPQVFSGTYKQALWGPQRSDWCLWSHVPWDLGIKRGISLKCWFAMWKLNSDHIRHLHILWWSKCLMMFHVFFTLSSPQARQPWQNIQIRCVSRLFSIGMRHIEQQPEGCFSLNLAPKEAAKRSLGSWNKTWDTLW